MTLKYIGREKINIDFNRLYIKRTKKLKLKGRCKEDTVDILFDEFSTDPEYFLRKYYSLNIIKVDIDDLLPMHNTPLVEIFRGYLEFLESRVCNKNTKSIYSFNIRVVKGIEVNDFSGVYREQVERKVINEDEKFPILRLELDFKTDIEDYLKLFGIEINEEDGVPLEIQNEWMDEYEKWLNNNFNIGDFKI